MKIIIEDSKIEEIKAYNAYKCISSLIKKFFKLLFEDIASASFRELIDVQYASAFFVFFP